VGQHKKINSVKHIHYNCIKTNIQQSCIAVQR